MPSDMNTLLFFILTVILFIMGSIITRSYILALFGLPFYVVAGITVSSVVTYIRELISDDHRPPVAGPMINQLIQFSKLFDYQTTLARKHSTYRLITPSHTEIYTADPVNVEYILKTNFSNYGKVKVLVQDNFIGESHVTTCENTDEHGPDVV